MLQRAMELRIAHHPLPHLMQRLQFGELYSAFPALSSSDGWGTPVLQQVAITLLSAKSSQDNIVASKVRIFLALSSALRYLHFLLDGVGATATHRRCAKGWILAWYARLGGDKEKWGQEWQRYSKLFDSEAGCRWWTQRIQMPIHNIRTMAQLIWLNDHHDILLAHCANNLDQLHALYAAVFSEERQVSDTIAFLKQQGVQLDPIAAAPDPPPTLATASASSHAAAAAASSSAAPPAAAAAASAPAAAAAPNVSLPHDQLAQAVLFAWRSKTVGGTNARSPFESQLRQVNGTSGWYRLSCDAAGLNCGYSALCAAYNRTMEDIKRALMEVFEQHFDDAALVPGARDGCSQATRSVTTTVRAFQRCKGPSRDDYRAQFKEQVNRQFREDDTLGGSREASILSYHSDYQHVRIIVVNFVNFADSPAFKQLSAVEQRSFDGCSQENEGLLWSVGAVAPARVVYLARTLMSVGENPVPHFSLLFRADDGQVQWQFEANSHHGNPAAAFRAMGRLWAEDYKDVGGSWDSGIVLDGDDDKPVASEAPQQAERAAAAAAASSTQLSVSPAASAVGASPVVDAVAVEDDASDSGSESSSGSTSNSDDHDAEELASDNEDGSEAEKRAFYASQFPALAEEAKQNNESEEAADDEENHEDESGDEEEDEEEEKSQSSTESFPPPKRRKSEQKEQQKNKKQKKAAAKVGGAAAAQKKRSSKNVRRSTVDQMDEESDGSSHASQVDASDEDMETSSDTPAAAAAAVSATPTRVKKSRARSIDIAAAEVELKPAEDDAVDEMIAKLQSALLNTSQCPFKMSFASKLPCPLAFLPQLEEMLDRYGMALVSPDSRDTAALQRELEPAVHESNPLARGWLMHFGGLNNNGKDEYASVIEKKAEQAQQRMAASSSSAAAAASSEHATVPSVQLHAPGPTFEEKIRHIEADHAAMFTNPTTRKEPPAGMSNRLYFKDVSTSGGWRKRANPPASAATPSAVPVAAAATDAAPAVPTGTKKQFFPSFDEKLATLFAGWDAALKDSKESKDDAAAAAASSSNNGDAEHVRHARTLQLFLERLEAGTNDSDAEPPTVRPAPVPGAATAPSKQTRLADKRAAAAALAKSRKRDATSFLIHSLYLNELQLHRRSLVLLSWVGFDGVKDYYLYLKIGFQFFNLHIEQMIFTFIHHQLEGESVWFIIPYSELQKLYKLAGTVYCQVYNVDHLDLTPAQLVTVGKLLVYGKQWWPAPTLLQASGITFHTVLLKAGEVLTADGDCAHFGFSSESGRTLSVAANTATDRWLKRGLPFLIDFFSWVGELEKFLKDDRHHQPAQPAGRSIHVLKTPQKLAEKALNQCPANFACSFMHGLRADLEKLASEEGADKAICNYPNLTKPANPNRPAGPRVVNQVQARVHAAQCQEVIELIHEHRPFLRQMDDQLTVCPACKPDPRTDKHTCMYCLCELPNAASHDDGSSSSSNNNAVSRKNKSSRSASRSSATSSVRAH